METNKLLHFVTVHDTQNLRQAAELLKMSHSALSKSLKTLEEEIGYALFVPDGRGITSTPKAAFFYQKAKHILAAVDALHDLSAQNEEKVLRIATFEVFSTYFLQLLRGALSEYRFELHETLQGSLEQVVLDSFVDFGITYEPIPVKGIEFLKISEATMSPYTRRGYFKDSNILDIPFAAPLKPVHGAPSGVKGLDGWPDHKFPRNIQFQVDMMESAVELARQGECAIFLPDFVARLHNKVVKSEFELEKRSYPKGMKLIKRSIFIVKRRNYLETQEIRKVARYLRSTT